MQPGKAVNPFQSSYADIETLLALHRFAWVPAMGDAVDPAWVDRIWRVWLEGYGEPDDSWAWHPYTAAERAINILDFSRRNGLPGDREKTLNALAAHGPAIAERLEYFGENNTSNHLSNNGRGLFRLGLELGLSDCTGRGADILLKEAERIFLPSGILREGSSHYHLLLSRNYADAWLAARRHKRPEERPLREIVSRALAVIPRLHLPGGLPLIGDISPDCPPGFLSGLMGGDEGWVGLLDADSKRAFIDLRDNTVAVDGDTLLRDGWLRFDYERWSGLWYAAPDGWPPMPGHGHQDCGGFEVHYDNEPVFIDLGRGAYGETGEAALYRSGITHNTVLLDGNDPYPANKPYYDETFRRRICGEPPSLCVEDDSVIVRHAGFSRLRGGGKTQRAWRFRPDEIDITDEISGRGHHVVLRCLHTELPVEKEENAVIIHGREAAYRVEADTEITLAPVTSWHAYGEGVPATALRIQSKKRLPCTVKLTVRVL
ncbi:MAG: heparinase II/III family protein [Rhodospirillales bacterium]